jgi:hypothetical protein
MPTFRITGLNKDARREEKTVVAATGQLAALKAQNAGLLLVEITQVSPEPPKPICRSPTAGNPAAIAVLPHLAYAGTLWTTTPRARDLEPRVPLTAPRDRGAVSPIPFFSRLDGVGLAPNRFRCVPLTGWPR